MNLGWAFVLTPTSSLRASFTRGCVGTNARTPSIGEKMQLQAPSPCCTARHSALLLLCCCQETAWCIRLFGTAQVGLRYPLHTGAWRLVSFLACMRPEHPQSGLPVSLHFLEFNARILGRALLKARLSASNPIQSNIIIYISSGSAFWL